MLRKLLVRNFILIDEITINFNPGLTVISGETGAGKSILLDAVKLLLQKKTTQKIKKHQDQTTIIELTFDNNIKEIKEILTTQSIEIEDDVIILKKSITKDNRVLSYINEYNISVKLLSLIINIYIEIHGQHNNNDLFNNAHHISYLDHKIQKHHHNLLDRLKQSYIKYKNTLQNYKTLKLKVSEYHQELNHLDDIIKHIEILKPVNNEYQNLVDTQINLKKNQNVQQLYTKYKQDFSASQGIQKQILNIQKDIINNLSHDEQKFSQILNEIEQILKSSDNILEILNDNNHHSESSLEEIAERISSYKTVSRKYAVNVLELQEFYEKSVSRKEEINQNLNTLIDIDKQLELSKKEFLLLSDQVNDIRKQVALNLTDEIHKSLQELYMEKTIFNIAFYPLDEIYWSEKGNNKVIFEVSTNPGQPYGELGKIASGGELSRFMLALKLALTSDKKTLIFDEIDTGISGRVSESVGNKLAKLSHNNQIIIITHQPQVAAKSNNHLRISKSYDINTTNVKIESLSENAKIEEIARMISGKHITEKAREAAKQIING